MNGQMDGWTSRRVEKRTNCRQRRVNSHEKSRKTIFQNRQVKDKAKQVKEQEIMHADQGRDRRNKRTKTI